MIVWSLNVQEYNYTFLVELNGDGYVKRCAAYNENPEKISIGYLIVSVIRGLAPKNKDRWFVYHHMEGVSIKHPYVIRTAYDVINYVGTLSRLGTLRNMVEK